MTWARGVRTIGRREVRKPKDSNLAGEAHGLDRLHEVRHMPGMANG